MIESAQEFIRLRNSEIPAEYNRSAHEEASDQTWLDVIDNFPEYKIWVVHNKTVPLSILEKLVSDFDPNVRCEIARKRKVNQLIISILSVDKDEQVRIALASNTKIRTSDLVKINRQGSEWFRKNLDEIITRKLP
jgi:hypothetical protein